MTVYSFTRVFVQLGAASSFPEIAIYLRRGDEDYITYITSFVGGLMINTTTKKEIKYLVENFFTNCPELVEKHKNGEMKNKKEIIKYIYDYNSCVDTK